MGLSVAAAMTVRSSRLGRFWRESPRSFRIGAAILLAHLVIAITGPFWAPFPFDRMGVGIPMSGPSWLHPFGTDQLGRDVFSRVIHGAHIVILLAFSGTALGQVIGAGIGLLSGYLQGWIDEVVMRLVEAVISIPLKVFALLAIAMAGHYAGEPLLIVFVIAVVYIPRAARIARAAALEIGPMDYVTVARLRGERPWSVVRREILPNATGPILVEFAVRAGYAPVLVGSLGFLGFGMSPPTPEWGLMIAEYRDLLFDAPITILGPCLALSSLVVGLNLCTEGVARMLGRSNVQPIPE